MELKHGLYERVKKENGTLRNVGMKENAKDQLYKDM